MLCTELISQVCNSEWRGGYYTLDEHFRRIHGFREIDDKHTSRGSNFQHALYWETVQQSICRKDEGLLCEI